MQWETKWKCNGKSAVDHNCWWCIFPKNSPACHRLQALLHLQLFLQEGFSLNLDITFYFFPSSSYSSPSSPPILLLWTNLGWRGDGYLNAKWCCNSARWRLVRPGDEEMRGVEGWVGGRLMRDTHTKQRQRREAEAGGCMRRGAKGEEEGGRKAHREWVTAKKRQRERGEREEEIKCEGDENGGKKGREKGKGEES